MNSNTEYTYLLSEFNAKYNRAITHFSDNNTEQLNNLKHFLTDRTLYQTANLKNLFLFIWALNYYKINEHGEVLSTSTLTTAEANNLFYQIQKITNIYC